MYSKQSRRMLQQSNADLGMSTGAVLNTFWTLCDILDNIHLWFCFVDSCRCGDADRCVADIYLPSKEGANSQETFTAKCHLNTSELKDMDQDPIDLGWPVAGFCQESIQTVGANLSCWSVELKFLSQGNKIKNNFYLLWIQEIVQHARHHC